MSRVTAVSDSRYADLKQVVLDELLAEHGDAQLDAQLHEAACMGALGRQTESRCGRRQEATGGGTGSC